MNPHDVLGTNSSMSPEEIQKQYRKMSLIHHPDHGGDPEKFKEINQAYEELLNEKTKDNEALSLFVSLITECFEKSNTPIKTAFENVELMLGNLGDKISSLEVKKSKLELKLKRFKKTNKRKKKDSEVRSSTLEIVETAIKATIQELSTKIEGIQSKISEIIQVREYVAILEETEQEPIPSTQKKSGFRSEYGYARQFTEEEREQMKEQLYKAFNRS
jgi:curved DNA-binding protein CbpA